MHAVECFRGGMDYESLVLDTNFITRPLKIILDHPHRDVLHRLAALKVRYARYRMSPAMTQGQEFPVDTDFLSLVRGQSTTVLARQLSVNTLNEFYHISHHSLFTNDEQLQRMGAKWDRLCHDVEEVAAVGEIQDMLDSLSQVWFINPASSARSRQLNINRSCIACGIISALLQFCLVCLWLVYSSDNILLALSTLKKTTRSTEPNYMLNHACHFYIRLSLTSSEAVNRR